MSRPQFASVWWPFGYIPIELAATKIYQQTPKSFPTGWAGTNDGATKIQDSMSKQILEVTTVPMFGKRRLETKLQEIVRGSFSNDRVSFLGDTLLYDGVPMFENVVIERRDMTKALQEVNSYVP